MTNELKPCPFCGGKPSVRLDKFSYGSDYRFTHTCKGRKTQFNIFSSGYTTRQAAIEAWNKRVEQTDTK